VRTHQGSVGFFIRMEKQNKQDLALIDASELSLTSENTLNEKQLERLLQKTPKQYVKERPAKGGGKWEYVTGGYIRKVLNLMFGWDWDFEIISEMIQGKEAIVKGRLTCRSNGKTITKMQYGNKDIVFKTEKVFNSDGTPKMIEKYGKQVQETKPTDEPLSLGNDLKAAATDCLKKCAAEIGIAADIYNKEDFREIKVGKGIDEFELVELFELKKENLTEDEIIFCERIIKNNEKTSFKKLHNFLINK
jgi:hypothetical protein